MTDTLAGASPWVTNLVHSIRARLGNTFVLHGNTHDLMGSGASYLPLTRFLAEQIFGRRQVVIEYQRANGPIFHTPESHKRFVAAVEVIDIVHGTDQARSLPREPVPFLALLDSFLQQCVRSKESCGVAVLFPYAETLLPEAASDGSPEDRAVRVFIQKWATDPALLMADVSFVLIAENLADLNARVIRSPQTIEIEVERPDQKERLAFLESIRDAQWYAKRSRLPAERIASLTSGLTHVQLRQVVAGVDERQVILDASVLREHKKTVIEAECYGLLEYVESTHTLDMVAGHQGVKERMRRAARAIMAGNLRGVPMGYLVAGPVGSAKTFLVNCFTGEIGFPCVKFLNFRSQWQGVTEGNLEKILSLLRSMWPVGVIIDEADAFLGDRNQQGDSGTSNRVFAQLATFMSNTDYRGRIVWFLITSRPDLLPIDLKRQGRAEEHLALFYPESDEEYEALFQVMLRKSGLQSKVVSIRDVVDNPAGMSGADIEAVLARAALMSDAEDIPGSVGVEVLRAAFADFIPASSPIERELQVLVAVQECTSRELLPARYRDLDRAVLRERINELHELLRD